MRGSIPSSLAEVDAQRGLRLVTTRSHRTQTVDRAIELLQPTHVQKVGGAGYKVLLLIDGRADVYCYPSPGTSKVNMIAYDLMGLSGMCVRVMLYCVLLVGC